MASVYFTAAWGAIEMLVSSVETERGRDVVVQSPSSGDKHGLSDRGKKLVRATCEVLFVNQPKLPDYLERYEAFTRAVESGTREIFVHPLDGSYPARVADVNVRHDAGERCVRVTCIILRDDEIETVFVPGPGVAAGAGVEEVEVAAARANDALEEIEMPEDYVGLETVDPSNPTERDDGLKYQVLADCVDRTSAWHDAEQLDSQDVFVGVAALASQIDDYIRENELDQVLERFPSWQRMMVLRHAVVRCGGGLTASEDRILDAYIAKAEPVLAIATRLYGAREAVDRADEIVRANRIRTPGLVPAGTTLKVPQPRSL